MKEIPPVPEWAYKLAQMFEAIRIKETSVKTKILRPSNFNEAIEWYEIYKQNHGEITFRDWLNTLPRVKLSPPGRKVK